MPLLPPVYASIVETTHPEALYTDVIVCVLYRLKESIHTDQRYAYTGVQAELLKMRSFASR